MIDLVKFIAACATPYDHVHNNCLMTATEAFQGAASVSRIREWWQHLDENYRVALSTGAAQIDLDELFYGHGFSRATGPTGCEIGAIKQLPEAPPVFVVGARGVWFARGVSRAVRVPRPAIVTHAWGVT